MTNQAQGTAMKTKSFTKALSSTALAIVLAAASAGALATATRGTQVDTRCAARPVQSAPPQQSRPYRASGNQCALCHTSNNFSRNDLNALGQAAASGGAAIDPFCVNTPPTGTPTISAPAAGSSVTAGSPVTFTGSGGTDPDGFPLTYNWSFTNGVAPATGSSVTVTAPSTGGSLTGTLEVRDGIGAAVATRPTRSVTVTAPVNQAPNGTITSPSANVQIAQGSSVNFQGSGTDPDSNTPLTYSWNFGGGAANSTAQNPGSVTFNTVGTFTVTFTVRDSLNLADPTPATRTVTVTAGAPPPNQAPNGSIAPPANIVQGQAVTFQGSATDPDGDTVTYAWNFGANATPATSSAQNPSVTFNTTGSRTVSLTVTDSRGLADPTPATVSVTVGAVPPPVVQQCPDADGDGFSSAGGACGPRDCNDSNPLINPGAREICGDGVDNDCDGNTDSADRECNGTDCVGSFLAKPVLITRARVERDDGRYELDVRGNQADPGAAVTVFNAGTGALLGTTTVRSSGDSVGTWEFDMDTSNPPCRVRVEINGATAEQAVAGAPSTCSGGGTPPPANQAPNGTITPPATIVLGQPVTFQGNGSDPDNNLPLSFAWTFGNSGVPASNAQNPAVTFSSTGTFPVTLTVRDSLGLADPTPATVNVTVTAPANRPPVAAITAPAGNVTVVQGASVDFAGSGSDPDGNPITFAWAFGGATPSSASVADPAPVTFNSVGTFTATLTVRDSAGATATATRSVTVTAPPPPVAVADSYTVAAGGTLTVPAPGVLGNDQNPSGAPLTAQLVTNVASSNLLTFNSNGSFIYSPASSFSGTDTFTYRAANGSVTSAPATVTITVTAAPPAQTLNVTRAEWDDGVLDVRGNGAPSRTTVTIRNASTGAVIGTTRSSSRGEFRTEIRRLREVPCTIRVEAGAQVGTRSVSDAPRNCQ